MTLSVTITQPANLPAPASPVNNHGVPDSPNFWGNDGFSFKSLLDTVNPLQHIPIVSTIYQALTGDKPSSGSNLAGGVLFGGPLGFASALFNEIIKQQTGNDIGGNVMAMVQSNGTAQLAQNDVSPGNTPSPANRAAYNAYMHTQNLLA